MKRPSPLVAALAATVLMLPVASPGRLAAFELVAPPTGSELSLVVGTGQLIKVDDEFSSLFVADPEVADVEVKSPRLLYLTGVGAGETTLFAVDDADTVLMSTKVRVTHNLEALRAGIRAVAPGRKVSATTVDQSLVLTGSVATPEEAENVLQVANQFIDDPARVVNRMSVETRCRSTCRCASPRSRAMSTASSASAGTPSAAASAARASASSAAAASPAPAVSRPRAG